MPILQFYRKREDAPTYSPTIFSDLSTTAMDFEGLFNTLKSSRSRASHLGTPGHVTPRDNSSLQPGNIRLVAKSSKKPSPSRKSQIKDADTSIDADDEDTENILAPLMNSSARPARRLPLPQWGM